MRALKALVIGMGILIALAFGLLVYGLVKRSAEPVSSAASGASTRGTAGGVARPYGPVAIALPPGARLIDTQASEGRLLVQLELAGGVRRVLVLDLASGALIGSIELTPQP
jgi:hypothetical protein